MVLLLLRLRVRLPRSQNKVVLLVIRGLGSDQKWRLARMHEVGTGERASRAVTREGEIENCAT